MYDAEKQRALDEKHAYDPQPGDYWQEMLCGICIVLERKRSKVVICKEKKDVEPGYWTWDLSKTEKMKLEDFRNWLSYGTIPGYWASVSAKPHTDVIKYWKAHKHEHRH